MGKRFTETAKWSDPWYRSLDPIAKHGWNYLCDNCDGAGVINLDRQLAEFQIGAAVDWDQLIATSDGRIILLANSKLWVSGFIAFQYPNGLSADCKAHLPILASIEKNGLKQTVSKDYPNSSRTVQETDKDKEKEKGGAGGKPETRFTKPTIEEVTAYCTERGKGVDPQKWFDHYLSNGWRVGRTPMKDWRATVRKWENSEFSSRGSPDTATKPPEYRPVPLSVFNQHKADGDFLTQPRREQADDKGYYRVYGQLRSKRKIESHTDPAWTPRQ
jgi:hypothetical protein